MDRMIQTLAERGVEFDATMIAFQLAFWGDDPQVRDRDVWAAHPAFVDNWRNRFRFDLGWEASDYAPAKALWPKVLRLVRMLYEAGVPMTIGTDMNNPFVAPGASLAREMQLHADAGIANWAVLRMATSEAARALDLEERTGRLREEMEADIVFLAEYQRDVRSFGGLASVYSSFYLQAAGADRPPLRGLNHFQLLRTDGRWRIVSNVAR